ncbi:hypothetical protein BOTBODRAFT_439872 [Botryobasidium botryosum FD-172 SS1]|uniref:Uncharacterized protein n=1 Tax=Botryobasidium botryosum (strain FD-172 SS1) TaxID=930990 RepID=A0A067MV40_BOTB1|nr:hypothetical protein BOTBODRAFT_439872 [Botryobasidium botryosum FD-172 SS1]
MELSLSTIISSLFQMLLDRAQLDRVNGDPPAHNPESPSIDLAAEARAALDYKLNIIELMVNLFNDHAARLLSTIRHRRNQHAPIHRLPPEMISLIFELAGPGAQRCYLKNDVPFNVMQVSRDWRQIAMESPRVWAHISMIPEPLLSTFLERSKNVPLELTFYRTTRKAMLHYMSHISPLHLERTRALKIDLTGMEMQIRKVESWLSTPLPALERLEISQLAEELVPPGGLNVGGVTARLRHLSLEGFFIPFDHPIYSNLVTLTLQSFAHIETHTAVLLLRVLEASPFLEELSLQDVGRTTAEPAPPAERVSSTQMVNLPHLRLLCLIRVAVPITQFLFAHITIPASSRTVLTVADVLPPGDEDIATIIPSQPESLRNITATTELTIFGKERAFQAEGRALESGGSFFLAIANGESGLSYRVLERFAKVVPMPHLQALTLFGFNRSKKDPGGLARALGHLTSLTTLQFHICHPTLVEIVTVSRARDRHVCPLLQNLTLLACSIKEEALLKLVRSRAFVPGDEPSLPGQPLERLDLIDCWKLTREVIPKLLEYVKVVYWGARRFEQVKAESVSAENSESG